MKIRNLPINVHIRLWGSFVNRIAGSAIWPFMALYLSEAVNKTFAGVFLASTVVFCFILNIIAGYICDRLPRKKLLVSISYAETVFLFLMVASVYMENIVLFLIMFTLELASATLKRPALGALVQDAATEDTKHLIYRLEYWLINLSLALGATIGGLFYQDHKVALFTLLAVTSLFVSTTYAIFIKETRAYVNDKVHDNIFKDVFHSYREVSQNRPFVILVLGGICIMYAEMSTSTYVAVRLAEHFKTIQLFGIEVTGVRMFSMINIINTLTVVSCTLWIGKFVERFKLRTVLIFGLSIYSMGYIVLTSANVWWLIIPAVLVATFGELIYSPIKNAEQLSLIPSNQRGAYQAFSNLGFNASDLLSKLGLIIGSVLNPLGMSVLMAVIVTIGSLCMLASLTNKEEVQR